jgi:hypothetical protein
VREATLGARARAGESARDRERRRWLANAQRTETIDFVRGNAEQRASRRAERRASSGGKRRDDDA